MKHKLLKLRYETLNKIKLNWSKKKSLCVVICSKGYPDGFKKNEEIENLENLKLTEDEYIFHAGTLKKNKKLYAVGGRVLNFVVTSENFSEAKNKILFNLDKLNWQDGFYRKDIGYRVIDK